jgi:hypothetical protein
VQFHGGQTAESIESIKKSLLIFPMAELAAPQEIAAIRAYRLLNETILALAYREQKNHGELSRRMTVLRDIIAQTEAVSSKLDGRSSSTKPWTLPFALCIAKRNLAQLEADTPAEPLDASSVVEQSP